ncbi:MAG: MFS transporter [Spirochaetales bacterium]
MSSPPQSRRWLNLFVLAIGNMVDTAETGLVNALFPALRHALHMNLEALGLLTAIGKLSRMIFGPLWSMAADRWNRKFLMFLVTGVWGFWTVAAGFAQNETQLLVLYALGSIGTVATEPLTASITSDLFPAQERGKAFGALRAIGGLGFVILAPIIGLLSRSPEGWRWAMFLLGGLSIVSGLLILAFFRDPGRGASEENDVGNDRLHWDDLKHLAKNRTIWFIAVSLLFTTSPVMISFAVTFMVDVRGFSNAEATFVLAVFIAGFIGSSLLGGWLGDRAHARWGAYGRVRLMQAYLVLFAVMSFLCLQIEWPHWAYYPLFLVFGLISSIGMPGSVMPLVSASVAPEVRSTAFGFLFSFVHGGITAALSVAVGWLGQAYGLPSAVLWLTTVAYTINALLWVVGRKWAFLPVEASEPPSGL